MPRSARLKSASDIYHVILRGINRQRIFEDDDDYRKFLSVLYKYRDECGFTVHAWCLMPNHVHLLMQEGREPLGIVFRRIGASYVYWYNLKYKRVGHLFQDRFRSEAVEDDAYFLTVVRYIHLNPVKAGLCDDPADYRYSSCNGYLDKGRLADPTMVSELLGREAYERFMAEPNEDQCIDVREQETIRLTDEEARRFLKREYCCDNVSQFQMLRNEERTEAVRKLIARGASIRQTSRLTGESIGKIRGMVQHREPSPVLKGAEAHGLE